MYAGPVNIFTKFWHCAHYKQIFQSSLGNGYLTSYRKRCYWPTTVRDIHAQNSLWPSDAIWRQRFESTLAQVMVCCLAVPIHYRGQCWFNIGKVLCHWTVSFKASRNAHESNHHNAFENYKFYSIPYPPGQWVQVSNDGIFSACCKQYILVTGHHLLFDSLPTALWERSHQFGLRPEFKDDDISRIRSAYLQTSKVSVMAVWSRHNILSIDMSCWRHTTRITTESVGLVLICV